MHDLILINQDLISTNSMMTLNHLTQEDYPCHHGSMALRMGCKHIRECEQILRSMAISLLHHYGYLN